MRIRFSVFPDILDSDSNVVTDADQLRKLSDVTYADYDLTTYLSNTIPEEAALKSLLTTDVHIRLTFDENRGRVEYFTDYECSRDLDESEVEKLLDYTQGQRIDGIGGSFTEFCESNFGLGFRDYSLYKGIEIRKTE